MDFDDWMEGINRVCELQFGLSINDLPDMLFRDAYDAGISPADFMAENLPDQEALREALFN